MHPIIKIWKLEIFNTCGIEYYWNNRLLFMSYPLYVTFILPQGKDGYNRELSINIAFGIFYEGRPLVKLPTWWWRMFFPNVRIEK